MTEQQIEAGIDTLREMTLEVHFANNHEERLEKLQSAQRFILTLWRLERIDYEQFEQCQIDVINANNHAVFMLQQSR